MFHHENCVRDAKALVSKMTLSEKISQLTYIFSSDRKAECPGLQLVE